MEPKEIYTKQVKWYESSTGKGNLALTVKGAALALIPLTISVLQSQGVTLTETQIAQFIEEVFTFVSLGLVLLGTVRKGYYLFKR